MKGFVLDSTEYYPPEKPFNQLKDEEKRTAIEIYKNNDKEKEEVIKKVHLEIFNKKNNLWERKH